MRRLSSCLPLFCLPLWGCMGTTPSLGHQPERGLSSILVGGRLILPTGETRNGQLWINFEGDGDHGNGWDYRLPIEPGAPLLYQVEPDTYHVGPTRSIFGRQQELLSVEIEGRTYRAPFPRNLQRKAAVVVKPTRIVALGVVEARLLTALPGREPELRVSLDDSVDARRKLIQDTIKEMMDPDAPAVYRNNLVQWTQALNQSLVDLISEPPPVQLYKRGAP